MSSEEGVSPETVREPRPFRLALVGAVIAIAAGAVVFSGVRTRAKTDETVAQRTTEQALPSVELITPKRGAEAQDLTLPGDIQAFSTAPIYARASGYVAAWYKDIGDKVKKGDRLAEIDSPDLDQQYAQVKADVANALATATLADATAKRYHELVGSSIVSKQSDEEKTADGMAKQASLEAAKANLARLQALMAFKSLQAPFDGIVTSRSIDIGALINGGGNSGIALYQISDLHRVRIYVRVPQAYVAEMKPGTKAVLRMPQYPGRSFDAQLVGTSNAISQESRTALIQLQADNPDGTLWPGTYTEVHFRLEPNPDALRLPATSLMFGEHGIQVATVGEDNKTELKSVQLGRDIGSDVEIVSGLSMNDRVIDAPLETLVSGDTVRVAKDNTVRAAPKLVKAD